MAERLSYKDMAVALETIFGKGVSYRKQDGSDGVFDLPVSLTTLEAIAEKMKGARVTQDELAATGLIIQGSNPDKKPNEPFHLDAKKTREALPNLADRISPAPVTGVSTDHKKSTDIIAAKKVPSSSAPVAKSDEAKKPRKEKIATVAPAHQKLDHYKLKKQHSEAANDLNLDAINLKALGIKRGNKTALSQLAENLKSIRANTADFTNNIEAAAHFSGVAKAAADGAVGKLTDVTTKLSLPDSKPVLLTNSL